MSHCIPSTPPPFSIIKLHKPPPHASKHRTAPLLKLPPAMAISKDHGVLGSEYNSLGQLRFKEKEGEENFKFGSSRVSNDAGAAESSHDLDVLGLEDNKHKKEEDLIRVEDDANIVEGSKRISGRRGRQVIKRSNMLAKQVISIQSALSLGFVSQIWVDTASWLVSIVEVRPNLLSGDSERFLLEDVSQIGDVVLVEDENVMENELKMVGLESLVGYRVVTPGRRNIGKVRGYSFNINSGAVESLELDSFGISIIPSSLVSTYALPVEDVLEVLSDAVVVHESAASHIQRLTKGFWDALNVGTKIEELEESDYEKSVRSPHGCSKHKSSGRRKFYPRAGDTDDGWEMPKDYL